MASPNPENTGTAPLVQENIVVYMDGTALDQEDDSNIMKLFSCTVRDDTQEVFYVNGVGKGLFSSAAKSKRLRILRKVAKLLGKVDAAVGISLHRKIAIAYLDICRSYKPGTKIFIIGFSRGGYTSKALCSLIEKIGILPPRYFKAYPREMLVGELECILKRQRRPYLFRSNLRKWPPGIEGRKYIEDQKFPVEVLGVFDIVASDGIPTELRSRYPERYRDPHLFGPEDALLEPTVVHHAYHALALNEDRLDFDPLIMTGTQEGIAAGQTLEQVGFLGCHANIGGGRLPDTGNDLSLLTLIWMKTKLVKHGMRMDLTTFHALIRPTTELGMEPVHDPKTGIYQNAYVKRRDFPRAAHEHAAYFSLHSSVPLQLQLVSHLNIQGDAVAECLQEETDILELWNAHVEAALAEENEESASQPTATLPSSDSDTDSRSMGKEGSLSDQYFAPDGENSRGSDSEV